MPRPAAGRWFKGNTHTHTVNSDGDSTPDEVVRWYREHGYNFLVLTDHNYLTASTGLNAVHGAPDKFIVIPRRRGHHDRGGQAGARERRRARELRAAQPSADDRGRSDPTGGRRHPPDRRRAAREPSELRLGGHADELRRSSGRSLFEIFNGHPQVNNVGGGGVPGLEEMWDRILTAAG